MPEKIMEIMPFLIPVIIVELALWGYTLWHIFTHKNYKRGTRVLWVIVATVGIEFIGPVLYFILGREES